MPDATITATTSIDTSGFGAGLEILKEQYRQATTEVRQSVQRVVDAEKQATDAIAAGHVQLGAKLSAVVAQEKADLNSLIREQDRLKASINEVNSAMKPQPTFDAAAALRQLAIVEALAAQGAIEEAAAVEAMGAAHKAVAVQITEARFAAQLFGRELGVPIPRALSSIAAQSSVLGPILQGAFSVVAAVAFAEVLFKVGEEVYKLFKEIEEAPQKIRDSFSVLESSARLANDELQKSNDQLRDEIAKIEHKPENAIRVALDDARVAADQLAISLNRDLTALQQLFEKNQVGAVRQILGEAATDDLEKELKVFQRKVAGISAQAIVPRQAEIGGVQLFDASSLKRLKEAEQLKTNTELTQAYTHEIQNLNHELQVAESLPGNAARVELLRGAIADLSAQQNSISLKSDHGDLEGKKSGAQAARDAATAATAAQRKQQEELKSGYDAMLADLKADHEVTKAEELAFRENELAEISQYGNKYVALQRQIARDIGTLQQEVDRQQDEAAKKRIADQKRLVEEGAQQAQTTGAENGQGGAQAKLAYYQAIDAASVLPEVYKAILDKIPEATRAAMRESSAALKTAIDEQFEIWTTGSRRSTEEVKAFWEGVARTYSTDTPIVEEATRKIAAATAKLREEQEKLAEQKIKGAEQQQLGGLNQQKLEVQRDSALSLDDSIAAKVAEAEALRAIDRQEAAAEIAAQQKIIDAKKALYGDDLKQYQADIDRKSQLQTQADQKDYAERTQILKLEQQQYQQFFNTITQGMQRTVDAWLTGQKSFASGLRSIWTGIVEQFVNYEIKRVAIWLAGTATIQAAETALTGILQALHITSAATTVTTDKAVGTQQVLTAAGTAAANAYSATAIIPVVGPELAPAAAATAYAGALSAGSLISAAGGADIPGTTGAILHAREMVLPAHLAERVRSMTGEGDQSGGDNHFHFNGGIHVNGAAGGNPGADFMKSVQMQIRKFKMA